MPAFCNQSETKVTYILKKNNNIVLFLHYPKQLMCVTNLTSAKKEMIPKANYIIISLKKY